MDFARIARTGACLVLATALNVLSAHPAFGQASPDASAPTSDAAAPLRDGGADALPAPPVSPPVVPPLSPPLGPPTAPPVEPDGPPPIEPASDIPVGLPQAPVRPGKAPRPKAVDTTDYVRRRLEPAGFPLIGGDSDIGLELGAVATLSYFSGGVKPYRWNMDIVAAISIKQGPGGAEIAQQNYLWNWDVPGLYGGKLRLNPEVSYAHTINYGYFGLGDASSATIPSSTTNPGRYHEWNEQIAQVRTAARVALVGPLSAVFAAQYLHVSPMAYDGSLLASDATARQSTGQPWLYGTTALSLPSLATGLAYDTRDSEVFPHSGVFDEVGVRGEEGFPTNAGARYVETGAILRGYVPLGPTFVLAARLVLNAQMGHVPFYDLLQAGPFDQKEMPGGSAGIRGVPVGRYLGPIKVIGNLEMRALWLHFGFLGQKFTLGNTVFFDTGRVWSDYTFHSPLDGSGPGLKFGVGAGIYFLWGQAAMLRIEAAYSPDAVSENPTLPVGIYVEDGIMF